MVNGWSERAGFLILGRDFRAFSGVSGKLAGIVVAAGAEAAGFGADAAKSRFLALLGITVLFVIADS